MDIQQKLLRIVRGQDEWSSVRSIGLSLRKDPSGWMWTFPETSVASTSVRIDDVLEGAKTLRLNPEAIREWASFMLAASSLITFEEFEESPKGEALLDELWSLSFGEDLENTLLRLDKLL